ncbi:FAD binding domain-containing protein [Zychaea mexicana]|uniref:FAD binding domain-containing protein n=1 Tax=Zychaea mexicana TaxID=64656 RepID=UPI0022FE6496|nr:FAD binding domain-containing protein [Zychaea mexicana]KAI9490181.1 FAD binding domain-containing protein [Zychaea mexicana]
MSSTQQFDVLIVGAGPSGLYAALLLGSMGVSVRIIDSKTYVSGSDNPALLLSPHTLQHLQAVDLVQPLVQNGMRHWRFQLYVNQGRGTNSISVERQSFRVWEKKSSQYNWALSCEATDVCNAFRDALYKRTDIRVDYQHRLVHLQDMTDHKNKSQSVDYPIVSTIKDLRTGRAFCWRSRMIIGADGADSLVRRKLGTPQRNRGMSCVAPLYTLQVTAESDFPGLRTVSVVRKGEDSVLLIGHRKKLYVILEQNPKWSQLALLDSDDDLLEAIHSHVQSILQPYDFRFTAIHEYRCWHATDPIVEEYSANRRWFLVGSAAQVISPPELLSANLGLDQVYNLCWKISKYCKNYASAHLLDTYETESRSRTNDYTVVSDALMAMITNAAVYEEDERGDVQSGNSSVASTPIQRLKWGKSWHIGGVAYPISDISRSSIQAPNGKLKPYNAMQLQTSPLSGPRRTRSTLAGKDTSSQLSITSPSVNSSTTSFLSRSRSLSSLAMRSKSFLGLPRTSTDSVPPDRFDPQKRPLTRSITRIKARGYQHYDNNSVVRANHPDTWRIIKANHYDLLERIAKDAQPGAFTILIFCNSLAEDRNLKSLQQFKQYMDTPSSMLQYEQRRLHDSRSSIPSESLYGTAPVTPTTSSETSSPRSSLSSGFTAATNRLSRFFSMWSSVSSIASSPLPPAPQSSPPPTPATASPLRLFSFLYITSSTRQQVQELLSNNSDSFMHSLFPKGLERLYIDHDNLTHSAYGINSNEPMIVVIRPDGYIGMRACIDQVDRLNDYFDAFMIPPVDLDSAAADVANDYLF